MRLATTAGKCVGKSKLSAGSGLRALYYIGVVILIVNTAVRQAGQVLGKLPVVKQS